MAGRMADEVVLSNEERTFLEAQVRGFFAIYVGVLGSGHSMMVPDVV